jgi:uncharacterized protein YbaR (Trm112 family)
MDSRITILSCPQCWQRLRVPVDRGELVLTCPRCRSRWDYSPPRPDDVRYIGEDVLFIGEGVPPDDPGQQPSGDGVAADLWDDDLDGPRPRERPGTVILPCPNCHRLLRVPIDRGELILTCPRCRTRWDWSPPAVGDQQTERGWGRWVVRLFQRRQAWQAGQEQQSESEPIRVVRPVVVPAQFFVCGPIVAACLALLPGFIAFVISNVPARTFQPIFGPCLVAFGLAFAIILGWIVLRVFYEPGLTSYAIYADRIEFEEGLWSHRRRMVLLDKIIEVRLAESLLQRMAAAGTISLVP